MSNAIGDLNPNHPIFQKIRDNPHQPDSYGVPAYLMQKIINDPDQEFWVMEDNHGPVNKRYCWIVFYNGEHFRFMYCELNSCSIGEGARG